MPRPDLAPSVAPTKYWQPEVWTARHELVCDLHIAGYDNREIARKLEKSEGWVSVILSDSRAAEYVRRARMAMEQGLAQDIYGRLQALAPDAIAAIEDDVKMARQLDEGQSLATKDRALRQKASFGVLASLGYGPISKNVPLSPSEVPPILLERSEHALAELREMRGMFTYRAPEEVEEAEFTVEADDAEAA